ncbi:hypothetical protein F5X99DRAFT_380502 [Biscogniauxia marginata]|nr:hypothetical protein F5X99DRAFT_380502 [Biscogniauxia marginata]
MPYDHHTLNPMASQETLVSMLHLDPTPMDSASIYEKDLPALPDEKTESSTSSLGLSGSRRGPIYYLTRIQRYSSYTFTFFAGLHFTNTALIPLIYRSVPYSEPFLLLTRELYQTSLTEPLLVGLPVLAHVTSGLAIRLIRRRQNINRYYGGATPGMWALHHSSSSTNSSSNSRRNSHTRVWPPLSTVSLSGYALLPLLASHVFVNRVLPLVVEGDSSNVGLQYVAHGFAREGLPPWVAYSLLLSVGVGHMVWGAAKWLDFAPPPNWARNTVDRVARKRQRRAAWALRGAVALVAGVWAAGGLGVVARAGKADGWLGGVYDGIYGWLGQAWAEVWDGLKDASTGLTAHFS